MFGGDHICRLGHDLVIHQRTWGGLEATCACWIFPLQVQRLPVQLVIPCVLLIVSFSRVHCRGGANERSVLQVRSTGPAVSGGQDLKPIDIPPPHVLARHSVWGYLPRFLRDECQSFQEINVNLISISSMKSRDIEVKISKATISSCYSLLLLLPSIPYPGSLGTCLGCTSVKPLETSALPGWIPCMKLP